MSTLNENGPPNGDPSCLDCADQRTETIGQPGQGFDQFDQLFNHRQLLSSVAADDPATSEFIDIPVNKADIWTVTS
ncbi:MAG: hypothetical protein Unbinned1312contig1001_6 [Prokaryotic dsDNA virus sp.]|nr:MAG: hypothetical protein Unbinned1312contig1001_6 [Prokaryotic dsDNA virus sp.]